MPFNRPPRLQRALPGDEVVLPSPPALPARPGPFSWVGTLIPLGLSLLAAVVMLAFAGGSALGYLMFLPALAGGGMVSWLAYRNQGKEYRERLAAAKAAYSAGIDLAESRLRSLRERELDIRRENHPPIRECLRRAQRADPRIGSRRPGDPDFLSMRIGTAGLPAAYRISSPAGGPAAPELGSLPERAAAVAQRYAWIADSPFTVNLQEAAPLGIAGAEDGVDSLARGLCGQIVTHHWPAEVGLAVCAGAKRLSAWTWVAPLPHVQPALPVVPAIDSGGLPTEWMAALESEIGRREQIQSTRRLMGAPPADAVPPLPCLVIFFDQAMSGYVHPAIRGVLQKGRALGIFGVFLASEARELPAECGAVVKFRRAGGTFQKAAAGEAAQIFRLEGAAGEECAAIARALGEIEWPDEADGSRPPAALGWLEMMGVDSPDDLPVETWWENGPPAGWLRAPIGKTSATADFVFDLSDRDGAHGPHGLIGGMTGSGKSEVLRTLILSLALAHHPCDLQFALVDYKGGAAFQDLAGLPHTVGVMTDIEGHAAYAGRFLAALSGEVERRKRLLEHARERFGFPRAHLDDYRRLPVRVPIPHLVVVFDEFAEFRERHPEESRRLIGIARLGRSLGVHLLLATQNIQAAVDPQILQNASFRICLKVSQAEDSVQMAGVPDAVALARGQALFYAQGSRLIQMAYTGGAVKNYPAGKNSSRQCPEKSDGNDSTEGNALIRRASAAAQILGVEKPAAIWKEPLPARIALPALCQSQWIGGWDGQGWTPCRRPGTDDHPVNPILGVCDLPERQTQPVLELSAERGGHLLVFGSAGTGKTSLLRTLVCSVARMASPAEAQIYIVDYGGQAALKPLEAFPHVGAVVLPGEEERLHRLLRWARRELERRSRLLRSAECGNWRECNRRAPEESRMPELFLIFDGFQYLRRACPPETLQEIAGLLGAGETCGLHLAAAAWGAADISNDLFSNIGQRLSFRQALQSEYLALVGMPGEATLRDEAAHPPIPGRGFCSGAAPVEFQAAMPSEGPEDRDQLEGIRTMASVMRANWRGAQPAPIQALPDLVRISELAPVEPDPWKIPVGMDFQELHPVDLDLRAAGPALLVAGSVPGCGKSTFLHTVLLQAVRRIPPGRLRLFLFDLPGGALTALRALPHVEMYASGAGEVRHALDTLISLQQKRSLSRDTQSCGQEGTDSPRGSVEEAAPVWWAVVDEYHRLAAWSEDIRRRIEKCMEIGEEAGFGCMAAGDAAQLPRDFDDGFIRKAHRSGCAFLLGPGSEAEPFSNARIPASFRDARFPAGRGFKLWRGRVDLFQTAVYWSPGETPEIAVKRRVDEIVAMYAAG